MSDPFASPRRWCVSGCFQATGNYKAVPVMMSPEIDPEWLILHQCSRCRGVDWVKTPWPRQPSVLCVPRFNTEAEALHRIARLEHAWRCQ